MPGNVKLASTSKTGHTRLIYFQELREYICLAQWLYRLHLGIVACFWRSPALWTPLRSPRTSGMLKALLARLAFQPPLFLGCVLARSAIQAVLFGGVAGRSEWEVFLAPVAEEPSSP